MEKQTVFITAELTPGCFLQTSIEMESRPMIGDNIDLSCFVDEQTMADLSDKATEILMDYYFKVTEIFITRSLDKSKNKYAGEIFTIEGIFEIEENERK